MPYQHTQRGLLGHLLSLFAVVLAVSAWFSRSEVGLPWILGGVAILFAALATMFQTLTISDGGDHLAIRFGPWSLFARTVNYADITDVKVARSSWIDGWGIHTIPGRGTTWNLWGFDCVELKVKGKTLRLGTDDAYRLQDLLNGCMERLVSSCHFVPSHRPSTGLEKTD